MQVEIINGILPERGSAGSAGLDLYLPTDYDLEPGLHLLPIGIKMSIPYNHYGQILCRSSLAIKGCSIEGGVIDQDYRGEIKVLLRTIQKLSFQKGDKIAQIVIIPYWSGTPVIEKLNETRRGEKGFGSTGR